MVLKVRGQNVLNERERELDHGNNLGNKCTINYEFTVFLLHIVVDHLSWLLTVISRSSLFFFLKEHILFKFQARLLFSILISLCPADGRPPQTLEETLPKGQNPHNMGKGPKAAASGLAKQIRKEAEGFVEKAPPPRVARWETTLGQRRAEPSATNPNPFDLGFRRHGIRRLRCCAAAASPRAGPRGRAAVWARARRDPPAEAGWGGEEGGEGGLPQPPLPRALRGDPARGPQFVPLSLQLLPP